MHWTTVIGVSLALAMDAFAVSLAAGLNLARVTPRHVFRLSFHFGLFQFLMPVTGWYVGREFAALIDGFDHWIAFGLLSLVGGRMLWEAFSDKQPETKADPTRGLLLVTLSTATSIDALAAGLSFAFLNESIWFLSVTIGIITALLTAFGMVFVSRSATRWGSRAEIVGGCILILIGFRIVFSHVVP
jgi:putative Mn2+ efflux pump MntP